jgi:ATP synthase mitochondrial F1 complex assembly factor 1
VQPIFRDDVRWFLCACVVDDNCSFQAVSYGSSHHSATLRTLSLRLSSSHSSLFLLHVSQGFFMLLSQFQDPNHFLLAYLEDYKMDPTSATPLLTFAVFTDFAETKDLSLVRADVLNASITDDEAYKVVSSVLSNYKSDDEYGSVQVFNRQSSDFDVDDYISRMNDRWNQS